MSVRLPVVLALIGLGGSIAPAWAKGDEDEEGGDDSGGDDKPDKKQKPAETEDDDKPKKDAQGSDLAKQDLSGHDLGTKKKTNEFEKDRFFVDKVDGAKTAKTTLVQGSLTSSSFFYTESGGNYATAGQGSDSSSFTRLFTDLRAQTDFRHISGGKWDARFDGRIRVVETPTATDYGLATGTGSTTPNHIQSGFNGQNEYELRELWALRNGERSDVFLGRQFIPDLGGIKIDGVRVDYASSKRLTLLGFAGLYPVRGSRSLSTDYVALKDNDGNSAGKFVGSGGFGAAYRTLDAYGAFGGVVLDPFAGEAPRFYTTSTGYYRYGPTLDFYHFLILDLLGSNGFGLTNLSAGVNYKPNPRLRITGSYNRVDTDTLNVQANAFLNPADKGAAGTAVQNETFIKRLATNQARVGVSAGLGPIQRYEISTALTYRFRSAVNLVSADGNTIFPLSAAKGVDLYLSAIDRRSFKDMRLGIDLSRSFAVGNTGYDRSEVLAFRAFGSRELANGHGEWEVEVSYATTVDKSAGNTCVGQPTSVDNCYGATNGSILSIGGNLYYRFNRDWLGIASLALNHQSITAVMGTTTTNDPSITGLTGFARVAYRF